MKKRNDNWFNAAVSFHNTVRFVQRTWNVPRVLAQEIQHMMALGKSQQDVQAVVDASFIFRNQVGF